MQLFRQCRELFMDGFDPSVVVVGMRVSAERDGDQQEPQGGGVSHVLCSLCLYIVSTATRIPTVLSRNIF